MTHDPIRAILLNELNTVTMALEDMGLPVTQQDLDAHDYWAERLCNVDHALQSLGQVIYMTQQERATLRLILEFYEGRPLEEQLGLRAYKTLLNKMRAS